ncbi:hypothetical protein AC249_AIPGENE17060 [Exaiptasia diaphana]|nr:hypothetical protein AC249_AIPGENE17060 [Exaiptasia diaphana]
MICKRLFASEYEECDCHCLMAELKEYKRKSELPLLLYCLPSVRLRAAAIITGEDGRYGRQSSSYGSHYCHDFISWIGFWKQDLESNSRPANFASVVTHKGIKTRRRA